MDFVHLQVFTAYSLLNSTIAIDKLIEEAVRLGYKALAITDVNVLYGVVEFYQKCHKHHIKPIIGMTTSILNEDETSYPLILLAQNEDGYRNLLKISSAIQTKSPNGLPLRWLKSYSSNLIALTPGFDGEIETLLLKDNYEGAKTAIKKYIEIFSCNRFFLSLHKSSQAKKYEKSLRQLAQNAKIKLVATAIVRYLLPDHKEALLSMSALLRNETVFAGANFDVDFSHLLSKTEVAEMFKDDAKALFCSVEISKLCNLELKFQQKLLPCFPVEKGQTAHEYLQQICQAGLRHRYKKVEEIHKNRLEYELSVIFRMGFADYFLIVWDFMNYARKRRFLVGPGRGSAAGSIVAYVLGITNVDPVAYGLLFERFLNPERISMPDIDIDFPDHARGEMIKYVSHKYGKMHVAQIITFGTFGAKSAIRDAARVYGLKDADLANISKQISSLPGASLKEVIYNSEELKKMINISETHRQMFKTAVIWEGLPRHTSTHAAGIVISATPLVESVALQGENDTFLTQFPMDQLEQIGLLKMDFLGLKNLTYLENILREINCQNRSHLTLNEIPLNDEKTYKLISKGETLGVFQLESLGMRNVLRQLAPSQFEDIVAVVALFRPGPMDNIKTYIKRKKGLEHVEYIHPDLESILKKTYGIIVYQEQILQIASKMAGFSFGEADLLRKAVSKKNKEILQKERAHFVTGALKCNYSEDIANEVYDLIVKFANYGFNRSHSVAYSLIAYQMAYLKAHYPAIFICEIMNNTLGERAKITSLTEELKANNVNIALPCINKSKFSFSVENKSTVRFGLGAIKNVSGLLAKKIFSERKNGKFLDFFDFFVRIPEKNLSDSDVFSLIYAGAFDSFGQNRATYLANIVAARNHASYVNPFGNGISLLGEMNLITPKYTEVAELDQMEKLIKEKESLGIYVSEHPLNVYQNYFQKKGVHLIGEGFVGKCYYGVYIYSTKLIRTKNGEQMMFMTVGDSSKEIDAVVFPEAFQKFSPIFKVENICLVEGKIERRNEKMQLVIFNAMSCDTLN